MIQVAVFTKNRVNPAYEAARAGADIAAARHGAMVTHYVPQHADHAGEQSQLLREALLERPDAVVIAPVHLTALNAALQQVAHAGIPMVGFISQIPDPPWLSFVGSDDRQLAATLATHVCARLGEAGDVVIVEGSRDSQTSTDRVHGFMDAIARFPRVCLVGTCHGRYEFAAARQEMDALLDRVTQVDAVIAANDVMALGVVEALRARARTALVAGVNAIPEAIRAIKTGAMMATADFNAMNIAATAVECAIRHVRGEPVPRTLMLPVAIVDSSNVMQWDKPYAERQVIAWRDAVRLAGPLHDMKSQA